MVLPKVEIQFCILYPVVTLLDKYESYEKTNNLFCPECGTPNACNMHRWINAKWFINYKNEKLVQVES